MIILPRSSTFFKSPKNAGSIQKENYLRSGLSGIKESKTAILTKEGFYSRRFTKKDILNLFNEVKLNPSIIKICPINYLAYAKKI